MWRECMVIMHHMIKVVLSLRFLYTLTLYSSNLYAIVSPPIWLVEQIGNMHSFAFA